MTWTEFVASAPGKIILSGEHAVVHGSHAIATVIDKRTYVTIQPCSQSIVSLNIIHKQLTQTHQWNIGEIIDIQNNTRFHPPFTSYDDSDTNILNQLIQHANGISTLSQFATPALAVFILYITHLLDDISTYQTGFTCTVHSELPMGSGLGSSASYTTALCTALLHLQTITNQNKQCICHQQYDNKHICIERQKKINWWSYQGERLIHGNPSGVDNTCSTYGGIIIYKKGTEFSRITNVPCINILVSNTGVEKNTRQLVSNVSELLNKYTTIIQPIFNSINEISINIVQLIKQYNTTIQATTNDTLTDHTIKFISELSILFRLNQHLLNGLGVGHTSIDSIVQLCNQYQIPCQSKLTGAGGGGCVITLLNNAMTEQNIGELIQQLITQCNVFDCFQTVIGQDGARIE